MVAKKPNFLDIPLFALIRVEWRSSHRNRFSYLTIINGQIFAIFPTKVVDHEIASSVGTLHSKIDTYDPPENQFPANATFKEMSC